MQTHSADKISAKIPTEYKDSDPALYTMSLRKSLPMFSTDGTMSMEGAQAVRAVLATSLEEVRNGKFDIANTFTND